MSDVATTTAAEIEPQRKRPTLDQIEVMILAAGGELRVGGPELEHFPERHIFTPGLYIRELRAPAGSVITSRIHTTEHPWVMSAGHASVYSDEDGPMDVRAPAFGITRAGTRRMAFVHEDMVWTTFHATELTDVDEVEKTIYAPWDNPYLRDIVIGGTT